MPAAALAPPVRRALAEIAGSVEPFDARFGAVGRFPGIVYLVPEPGGRFTTLTDTIAARFPEYQPYEGAFEESSLTSRSWSRRRRRSTRSPMPRSVTCRSRIGCR
jgi:hypothetical protein